MIPEPIMVDFEDPKKNIVVNTIGYEADKYETDKMVSFYQHSRNGGQNYGQDGNKMGPLNPQRHNTPTP